MPFTYYSRRKITSGLSDRLPEGYYSADAVDKKFRELKTENAQLKEKLAAIGERCSQCNHAGPLVICEKCYRECENALYSYEAHYPNFEVLKEENGRLGLLYDAQCDVSIKLREENARLKEKLENCRGIQRCMYHDSCPNEGCVFDDVFPDSEPPAPNDPGYDEHNDVPRAGGTPAVASSPRVGSGKAGEPNDYRSQVYMDKLFEAVTSTRVLPCSRCKHYMRDDGVPFSCKHCRAIITFKIVEAPDRFVEEIPDEPPAPNTPKLPTRPEIKPRVGVAPGIPLSDKGVGGDGDGKAGGPLVNLLGDFGSVSGKNVRLGQYGIHVDGNVILYDAIDHVFVRNLCVWARKGWDREEPTMEQVKIACLEAVGHDDVLLALHWLGEEVRKRAPITADELHEIDEEGWEQ